MLVVGLLVAGGVIPALANFGTAFRRQGPRRRQQRIVRARDNAVNGSIDVPKTLPGMTTAPTIMPQTNDP